MSLMPNFDAMKVAKPDFFRAITSLTGTTKLTVRNRIVHVTVTGVSAIELPPVGDFAGETVAIYCPANAGTDALTIQDKDDSFNWVDIVLNAADESLVLYSDGLQWFIIGGTEVLIASVTASAVELNYNDIASLGTGAASKAVVLNSGEDYVWPSDGILTYGVLKDPAGTTLVATVKEINDQLDRSARIIDVTGASVSITLADHAGRIVTLNRAGGIAVTLPAALGTGARYYFYVGTTFSGSATIKVANATDVFDGGLALGVDTDAEGSSGYTWYAVAGDDTITMEGVARGGVKGDIIEIIDVAAGFFAVKAHLQQSGGTEVTPFSATVG